MEQQLQMAHVYPHSLRCDWIGSIVRGDTSCAPAPHRRFRIVRIV